MIYKVSLPKKFSSGQSILEVLFATTVVALVLVAILSTIIASLRNARTSLEQTQATKYGQEVLEWLRRERDEKGWLVFSNSGGGVGTQLEFCLPQLPASVEVINSYSGECQPTEFISGTSIIRSIVWNRISIEQIEVTVTVIRPDTSGQVSTQLTGHFTLWQ